MPMEELLAMYGYGNQQPLLPASDPAASQSANGSVGSSSSSSDAEDETASAAAASDDGQLRNGGSSLITDTALHTSRLLRCKQCISFVNKTDSSRLRFLRVLTETA